MHVSIPLSTIASLLIPSFDSRFKFSQLEISTCPTLLQCDLALTTTFAEVVLNVLLSKFRVTPSKEAKNIVWNMAGVRHPTMKGDLHPTFPVRLERLNA